MVSMFLKRLSKVRKTQFLSFSIKFSFLLRDKIHPRRTPVFSKFASEFGAQGRFSPLAGFVLQSLRSALTRFSRLKAFVRLTGGYLPVPAIFSYPLRAVKKLTFLYSPFFLASTAFVGTNATKICHYLIYLAILPSISVRPSSKKDKSLCQRRFSSLNAHGHAGSHCEGLKGLTP